MEIKNNKLKLMHLFRNTPGWAIMAAVFGLLYLCNLHTEVFGQVQRVLLATGIRQADVAELPHSNTSEEEINEAFGQGFKLQRLDGETIDFESLKGKVIFLNIWATWCPPCIAEMPNIQSLYEKVDQEKVAFVMLSVDQEGTEKVKKFISKKGYTFPVYLPLSRVPEAFHTRSIPTTFIISPKGEIAHRQDGMANYDTQEVRDFLQALAQ